MFLLKQNISVAALAMCVTTMAANSGKALAKSPYEVQHQWTVDFEPEWSFDAVHLGVGLVGNDTALSIDVADFQKGLFRARLLSSWVSLDNGRNPYATSILPVGLSIPPYGWEKLRPYYFFHWSILGHEVGVETGPGEESGLGLRLAGVYSQDFTAVTLGASFGGTSDDSYATYDDYYGSRFGLGGIGVSFGASSETGVRGSFLDFQFGPFMTSLVDYDLTEGEKVPHLLSVLPIGLALPPAPEGWLMPYYKFHWTPIAYQLSLGESDLKKLAGMHTLGLGLIVPEDAPISPLLRVSVTTGVDFNGQSSTRFAVELETVYLFALIRVQ